MNQQYGDYNWRPSHDIEKPDFKVGQKVIHGKKIKTITHVDKHVYPICVDGERVSLKDIKELNEEGKCHSYGEQTIESI